MIGVFVAKTAKGARVVVTGAGNGVIRIKSMEAALDKAWSAASLDGIAVSASACNGDIHGSSEYRAHLISVMAKRAVAAAG
jgi:carbon-monoxide dehydrogenase medium subunit